MIAVGLAMDAFAVAICQGLKMPFLKVKDGLIIAACFGFFQAFMPFVGYLFGSQFEKYITSIDHWIAFILLGIIGFNMIKEAFDKDDEEGQEYVLNVKEVLIMGIATSIDALVVGITFAFLSVDITLAVGSIGIITFVISFIGILIGHFFGSKFKNKAEFIGGIILIFIGFNILLEHLGVL